MKIYLANTISRQSIVEEILKEDGITIPYMLESFYYIKPVQIAYFKKYCKSFMLDSGAFTFMNQKRNTTLKAINFFTDKYIQFINENDIDLFFEMDLDKIIGLSEVEKLRYRIESETGKKSIPVFHPERGKDYFIDMIKEYDYIALGGSALKKPQHYIKYFPYFIKEAKKHNCKIHGLGFTALSKLHLPQYRFTSVDSSTWVQSVRFHSIFKFKNGKMNLIKSDIRKRKSNSKISKNNLIEWIKYSEYMSKFD